MNRIAQWAAVLGLAVSGIALPVSRACADDGPTPGIAVVELFTSEGCSSCPPADAALADLIRDNKGGHVHALAFHVDYWDELGWADPYAQRSFTDRQRDYAQALRLDTVYTPQVVVNGQKEFVGSRRTELRQAVADALARPARGTLTATTKRDQAAAKIEIATTGVRSGSAVRVALVQSGLSSRVRRGENGGRTLTHENVVRSFVSATVGDDGRATAVLPAPKGGWPAGASVVIFAQQADSHVVAATEIKADAFAVP